MKGKSLLMVLALVSANVAAMPVVAFDSPSALAQAKQASGQDMVSFNTESKKYHALSCPMLKKCKRCKKMTRAIAKQLGGYPCRLCGGGEK